LLEAYVLSGTSVRGSNRAARTLLSSQPDPTLVPRCVCAFKRFVDLLQIWVVEVTLANAKCAE